MRRIIPGGGLLLVLVVLTSTDFSSPVQAEEFVPPKKPFHIYLLMGQSNMAGRGKMIPSDKLAHPRVFKLDKQNRWVPATAPLHFDKPTIAGYGIGNAFGKILADANPKARIGLVPCAFGGTPLKRWVKGGDLYANAIKRAKIAMKHGELKGMIWHQGESDSRSVETASSYGKRLAGMIRNLRKDLDVDHLPVVIGELGEFLNPKRLPHFRTVNRQIRSIPEMVANTAVVPAKGLKPKKDGVHFDRASLKIFGSRYAEIMQRLQKKRTEK